MTSTTVDPKYIMDFGAYLTKVAKGKRTNAGYGGEHHDGGASHLEAMLQCYRAGFNKLSFPIGDYDTDFRNSQNPEWIEYMRLKRKFAE